MLYNVMKAIPSNGMGLNAQAECLYLTACVPSLLMKHDKAIYTFGLTDTICTSRHTLILFCYSFNFIFRSFS